MCEYRFRIGRPFSTYVSEMKPMFCQGMNYSLSELDRTICRVRYEYRASATARLTGREELDTVG